MIVPVILSGGSGTRLWPLSTAERPKQFIALIGSDSLFRQTLARVADRRAFAPPIVVANEAHEELCASELDDCPGAQLILEPCPRNTAAAIVLAAEAVRTTHGDEAKMLVMPSDHLIGDLAGFDAAVQVATIAATSGQLVTFGVVPTAPETGYGYVEASRDSLAGCPGAFAVSSFTEKPDLPTAQSMIATGRHFWNGGIFLFRAKDILEESASLAPEVYGCALRAMRKANLAGHCIHPALADLAGCPDISIDYAVMERSSRVAMVPLSAQWSDVGSWDALAELDRDSPRTTEVLAVDSDNCYVRTDSLKVGLLGVSDLVIVASGNRLLVMRRGHSQNIRQLAAKVA